MNNLNLSSHEMSHNCVMSKRQFGKTMTSTGFTAYKKFQHRFSDSSAGSGRFVVNDVPEWSRWSRCCLKKRFALHHREYYTLFYAGMRAPVKESSSNTAQAQWRMFFGTLLFRYFLSLALKYIRNTFSEFVVLIFLNVKYNMHHHHHGLV